MTQSQIELENKWSLYLTVRLSLFFSFSEWAFLGEWDFQTSLTKWDYHQALYVTVYTHIGHFDILESFQNSVFFAPSCAEAQWQMKRLHSVQMV